MKYRVEIETEDGWTDWIKPVGMAHKIACCDCGLIHVIEFRVVKGKVQFRASRDMRATAQRRRYLKPRTTRRGEIRPG